MSKIYVHITRTPPTLTEREREVLKWTADGKRNEDIAAIVHSTPKAIQANLRRIMDKTGTGTRTGAVAFALRKGLIT